MSDNKVKELISDLFVEMNEEVSDIISSAHNTEAATKEVMEYVSNTIIAAVQGYMVDLYGILSKETLKEPVFQEPENANKFYELNIRKQIYDAYQFDIKDLKSYCGGIDFKEINSAYVTAATAVGTGAVVGILLGALSGVVKLPLVVIIAGAVLAGAAGGYVANTKVPEKNKEKFKDSIKRFMSDLEDDLLEWVDEVEKFYNDKVNELKETL